MDEKENCNSISETNLHSSSIKQFLNAKQNLRSQVLWFHSMFSVSDSPFKMEEKKRETIMTVVLNHRKDVDM